MGAAGATPQADGRPRVAFQTSWLWHAFTPTLSLRDRTPHAFIAPPADVGLDTPPARRSAYASLRRCGHGFTSGGWSRRWYCVDT